MLVFDFFQQIQKITNLCQIFVLLNWSGLIKMPLWIHPQATSGPISEAGAVVVVSGHWSPIGISEAEVAGRLVLRESGRRENWLNSDALRNSLTTSSGAGRNQTHPCFPFYWKEVRWTICFGVMYTGNSRSDFVKLAIAGIRWELPWMAKLYKCLSVTRYGVVHSPPSSWKCNTLFRNTESPHDFRGGGIFHKCLSSEIIGGRKISVFA